MLNQNHNVHKRTNSKILLILLCIFGLLFSYSCSCKNRVSNPDGGGGDGGGQFVDPDTFAIKEATGNVVASIVQSSKTVGDIKIAFAEANNHDYTMDYTIEDANETVEANKIDKTNFQVVNNVLTASESLLTKVRALNTDNGPARKTITINFTFKANDTSLKNNTQTLSVEVKLTHAKKLEQDSDFQTIFAVNRDIPSNMRGDATKGETEEFLEFHFGNGTFTTDTYTINNSTTGTAPSVVFDKDNKGEDIAAKLKRNVEFYYSPLKAISKFEFVNEAGINTATYTLTYNVTFSDEYEVAKNPTEIKFAFKAAKQ